jgi:hypothetical protein
MGYAIAQQTQELRTFSIAVEQETQAAIPALFLVLLLSFLLSLAP